MSVANVLLSRGSIFCGICFRKAYLTSRRTPHNGVTYIGSSQFMAVVFWQYVKEADNYIPTKTLLHAARRKTTTTTTKANKIKIGRTQQYGSDFCFSNLLLHSIVSAVLERLCSDWKRRLERSTCPAGCLACRCIMMRHLYSSMNKTVVSV